VIAAVVALAVGELVAGLSSAFDSPVVVVGDEIIERVPRPVKDLAIDWFGTNDKTALIVGILAVALVLGAVVGLLGRRNRWWGVAGLGLFAVLGVAAAYSSIDSDWYAALPSVLAWLAGSAALWWLLDLASVPPEADAEMTASSRRQFILGGTAVVAGAALLGSSGRWLQRRFTAEASRLAVVLPRAARRAPAPPDGVELGVEGIAPWRTPSSDFYRIDTALVVPQVAAEGWTLRIHGMVDRELEITYDELLERELVEEDITLCCVSNEIGGDLIGNARWLGARLDDLLAEAGVSPDADQIVGRSADDFTAGFPVSTLDDGRPALVAVGMNGKPLPIRHGFPARLVVPGLYGYVSATKWLTEIELTTFDDFEAYWIERQWGVDGPVKLMSRIDTPVGLARVAPGPVAIGGVAWAQPVGIERVEVRVDGGQWAEARLGDEANTNTWRQWSLDWEATPGRHEIQVRATDHEGNVQTESRAEPFPDGATGWHQVVVNVDGA
jgi:DMSO/TMAO reductase YedYZ molybdopterin-dependent catalytic subunit